MSVDNARKFYEKLQSDPKVEEEVSKLADEICKVGEKYGHTFTKSDFKLFLKEAWNMAEQSTQGGQEDPDTCFSEPPTF